MPDMTKEMESQNPESQRAILELIECAMQNDMEGAITAAQNLATDRFKERITHSFNTQDLF